jgi:hypothetical protein
VDALAYDYSADGKTATAHERHVSSGTYLFFYACFGLLYLPSPLFFAILCWNNLHSDVLRLLWRQLQFKVVVALTIWIMVVDAWRWAEVRDRAVYAAVGQSLCTFSPLLVILFKDAMIVSSRPFRLALPAMYLAYIMTLYINYGYIRTATPLLKDGLNSTDGTVVVLAAEASFQGQITGCLMSLIVVMCRFLKKAICSAVKGNDTIMFPLDIIDLKKSSAKFILMRGGNVEL